MKASETLDFYLARAEQERENGRAATLSHVRARCARSAAAWDELAERAQRGLKTRAVEAERLAVRDAREGR